MVFMIEAMANTPIGMEYTNRHDLPDLMSKNNFTTEAPLIFSMFIHKILNTGPMVIKAVQGDDGSLGTCAEQESLTSVLGIDPDRASFSFETSYEGYNRFALHQHADRSDVVVLDRNTNEHRSAFEVKLCVIPNSSTAEKTHDEQGLEIVVRPSTIEQLAFSIADTYGDSGRSELNRLIVEKLGGNAQGYQWSDENYMLRHMEDIREAVTSIATMKIEQQKPFALIGIWRTHGQSELLEDHCFDTFAWTNLAFLQLLNSRPTRNRLSRPDRSLIWLVKALYDFSVQGIVDFNQAHSEITFGTQTDKAGSFAGKSTSKFMECERFIHPLISRADIPRMLPPECVQCLKPERRLDAALKNALAE